MYFWVCIQTNAYIIQDVVLCHQGSHFQYDRVRSHQNKDTLDEILLILFKLVSSDVLMLYNVSNGRLWGFLTTSNISISSLLEF